MKRLIGFSVAWLLACNSYADTWVPASTHVKNIATSQLFKQNAVIFTLDKGTSDCAAGSYVYYYSNNMDELKTMHATMLAMFLAGTPVIVHFSTSNCVTDAVGVGS